MLRSGNPLWTTVGSNASARVILYGLLFQCFGTGNSLWATVGFDASARVIPYGPKPTAPLWRAQPLAVCASSPSELNPDATRGEQAPFVVENYFNLRRVRKLGSYCSSSTSADVAVRSSPCGHRCTQRIIPSKTPLTVQASDAGKDFIGAMKFSRGFFIDFGKIAMDGGALPTRAARDGLPPTYCRPTTRFRCFGLGNPLWTTVGSDASTWVIPYYCRFRCFGTGNPLWTTVGFDASARVIPYGPNATP
ncbi:hypothetical protein GQ457_HM001710 [Hibiscus cannabinus]